MKFAHVAALAVIWIGACVGAVTLDMGQIYIAAVAATVCWTVAVVTELDA